MQWEEAEGSGSNEKERSEALVEGGKGKIKGVMMTKEEKSGDKKKNVDGDRVSLRVEGGFSASRPARLTSALISVRSTSVLRTEICR